MAESVSVHGGTQVFFRNDNRWIVFPIVRTQPLVGLSSPYYQEAGRRNMFEVFDHTADVGIRVMATNVADLFSEAALGLFSLIVVDAETIREQQQVRIEIGGDELEYLLFDWLSELLYRYETEKHLFRRFDVAVNPDGLKAVCHGEFVAHARHELFHEVKAITYHDLKVHREADQWLAEVIVDI